MSKNNLRGPGLWGIRSLNLIFFNITIRYSWITSAPRSPWQMKALIKLLVDTVHWLFSFTILSLCSEKAVMMNILWRHCLIFFKTISLHKDCDGDSWFVSSYSRSSLILSPLHNGWAKPAGWTLIFCSFFTTFFQPRSPGLLSSHPPSLALGGREDERSWELGCTTLSLLYNTALYIHNMRRRYFIAIALYFTITMTMLWRNSWSITGQMLENWRQLFVTSSIQI